MSPEALSYHLLYILGCLCIIYPPTEFISSGMTIPGIFGSFLGSEAEQFVMYHIRRTTLTLFLYSVLPLGYIMGLWLFDFIEEVSVLSSMFFWQAFTATSVVLPLLALYQIKNWSWDNWCNHPIAVNIAKFCNNNSSWMSVASDINAEFRRVDKICIQTSAICKVVATENWILKMTPLTIFLVHQSDATLEAVQSDAHSLSPDNIGEIQYVNIQVKSTRGNVEPFIIRLNALDFRELQDRVGRLITVLPNVKFHKSLMDRFIDTFKDVIADNPRYVTNQELENCIGCMQTPANVKLQKVCLNNSENEGCVTCYCRPMWCAECMARWFASRQDGEQPETWLSSKCTCPMCRAKFCILDVCLIENE